MLTSLLNNQQIIFAQDAPLVKDAELLVQAEIVSLGDKNNLGQLVIGVTIAWGPILKAIREDPDFIHRLSWRKVEELIAAAYEREGWPEVILTPRSGDKGRDVIATKPGFGSIRIFDQVKAYKPGNTVPLDDVRGLLGVLTRDQNVSKGVLTTTSDFAPSTAEEFKDFIPHRIELVNGALLRQRLNQLK